MYKSTIQKWIKQRDEEQQQMLSQSCKSDIKWGAKAKSSILLS